MIRNGTSAGSARVTIVTGARDSGKTRAAAAFVARLRLTGIRAGGVLSEAALVHGVKIRYSFRDVLTGAEALYAVRRKDAVPPGELAYTFIEEGLAFGRAAIRRGIDPANAVGVLVIDELGPLEMAGGGLWEAFREAAAAYPGRMLLTVRPTLLASLRERLPFDPAEIEVVPPAPSDDDP